MTIKLYYFAASPPCRAVNLTVHALGLYVNYITVSLIEKDNLKPDFLKVNPQHTIPTIDDDGFVLWDSHAISQYLVSKYGEDDDPLYPKDLRKRAIVDQRLHYSNDVFGVITNVVRPFFVEGKTRVTDEDRKRAKEEIYDVVEMYLDGRQWIAGDMMTIADFHYISGLSTFKYFIPPGDGYPNVKAWMDRCAGNMKDYEIANNYDEVPVQIKVHLSQEVSE